MPQRNVISNYAAWRGEVVGYRTTPLSSLSVFMKVLSEVRDELPQVGAPLLVIHSTGDQTVPATNAPYIMSRVSSVHKAVRVYPGGRHLLTLPPYLDTVKMDVVRFLHSCEAPSVTGPPA
jgi:carboxylesterase